MNSDHDRGRHRGLRATLKALKLGQMLDTLPDRLTLARQQHMTHADFLQLVLADEVTRREAKSAALRARAAGLDAGMRIDTWDDSAAVSYDRQLGRAGLPAVPRRPVRRPCPGPARNCLTLRMPFIGAGRTVHPGRA